MQCHARTHDTQTQSSNHSLKQSVGSKDQCSASAASGLSPRPQAQATSTDYNYRGHARFVLPLSSASCANAMQTPSARPPLRREARGEGVIDTLVLSLHGWGTASREEGRRGRNNSTERAAVGVGGAALTHSHRGESCPQPSAAARRTPLLCLLLCLTAECPPRGPKDRGSVALQVSFIWTDRQGFPNPA